MKYFLTLAIAILLTSFVGIGQETSVEFVGWSTGNGFRYSITTDSNHVMKGHNASYERVSENPYYYRTIIVDSISISVAKRKRLTIKYFKNGIWVIYDKRRFLNPIYF